jgi:hypothetical protein
MPNVEVPGLLVYAKIRRGEKGFGIKERAILPCGCRNFKSLEKITPYPLP